MVILCEFFSDEKVDTEHMEEGAGRTSTVPEPDYDAETLEPLPYFDLNATLNTNLTIQMGTDVALVCRVNRLGDKVVSAS